MDEVIDGSTFPWHSLPDSVSDNFVIDAIAGC